MKIKKTEKPKMQSLPSTTVKYTLVVPLIGVMDALTMGSFATGPAFQGHLFMQAFSVLFALVGVCFALWGFLWKTVVDKKDIRVNPVIGRKKKLPFEALKQVVIHNKTKNGSMVFYELVDKDGNGIVRIYPMMRDSATLLERLKRFGVPVREVADR
ncbi:MAG: hypothetical protein HFE83_11025 [Lachnospiraceae bacterium]|nr:hypothetical protein [Lachnospiraceae bacterium]